MKPTGYILWQGKSLLDGAPIVAIAITRSSNRKTGDMVQTYILRADVDPVTAVREGLDQSICGGCPHRGVPSREVRRELVRTLKRRSCYVNVGQGPLSVFRAMQRGRYPVASDITALGRGRVVRLGTYGDPAAVPAWVWLLLLADSDGHTGYTHQYRNPAISRDQRDAIARLCMVSADTPQDASFARKAGVRYFRVRLADEPLAPREFVCPASEEAGKRLQCHECRACSGSASGKSSPVIVAHGALAGNYRHFRIAVAA